MKETDVLRIFCVFRNTIKQIQNVQNVTQEKGHVA